MDFKVLYTEPALADLQAVVVWSWGKNPDTTQGFADALLNHVDLLAVFPLLGSPVKGHPGVRRLLHSPLELYYRVDELNRSIEILQIWR